MKKDKRITTKITEKLKNVVEFGNVTCYYTDCVESLKIKYLAKQSKGCDAKL